MAAQRRKFTDDEKLNVLHQAGQQGVSQILRHYNLSYSVFARWKQNFLKQGIDPIGAKSENKLLLEENIRLKKIVADLALSLELKSEDLKRMQSLNEKKT
jgi:putative transposase